MMQSVISVGCMYLCIQPVSCSTNHYYKEKIHLYAFVCILMDGPYSPDFGERRVEVTFTKLRHWTACSKE
jgi:hypothetical protein